MQAGRNRQVLSEQTSDSSAFLNALCLLKHVLSCDQRFRFLILRSGLLDILINCNRITEGLLSCTLMSSCLSVRMLSIHESISEKFWVRFQVLTALTVTPCSQVDFHWNKEAAVYWLLASFYFQPWRRLQYLLLKFRWRCAGLRSVTSQNISIRAPEDIKCNTITVFGRNFHIISFTNFATQIINWLLQFILTVLY
jgi:hypothetical protein